jgi:hypothetical protein
LTKKKAQLLLVYKGEESSDATRRCGIGFLGFDLAMESKKAGILGFSARRYEAKLLGFAKR